MTTITYAQIAQAVLEQCPRGKYPMSLTGETATCVHKAVNQGIDGRLEACFMPTREDRYEWDTRQVGDRTICACLNCQVSPDSLPVLVRRLSEADDEESITLARDILGTLEFDVETGCYEVVSPVDEPAETHPA